MATLLRRGSTAARLLGFLGRIPLGAWIPDSCECVVLSGGGLCFGLITRPEDSYRALMCVCVSVCLSNLDNDESLAL